MKRGENMQLLKYEETNQKGEEKKKISMTDEGGEVRRKVKGKSKIFVYICLFVDKKTIQNYSNSANDEYVSEHKHTHTWKRQQQ